MAAFEVLPYPGNTLEYTTLRLWCMSSELFAQNRVCEIIYSIYRHRKWMGLFDGENGVCKLVEYLLAYHCFNFR